MTSKRLYIILILALITGFALLVYEFMAAGSGYLPDLCIFRHVTGIPCPSCGSTRSVVALLHGHISEAFMLNPAGLVIAFIMFSAPLWITFDLVTGKKTLFGFYIRTETLVRRPTVACLLICIVLANWIWNIQKGI